VKSVEQFREIAWKSPGCSNKLLRNISSINYKTEGDPLGIHIMTMFRLKIRQGSVLYIIVCLFLFFLVGCQPVIDEIMKSIPTGEAQLSRKKIRNTTTPTVTHTQQYISSSTQAEILDANVEMKTCLKAVAGSPFDITIPDGTRLSPGESFLKTWRIMNVGTCEWTSDFSLVWVYGDQLGSVQQKHLKMTVFPGQEVDLTVEMTAPMVPGTYRSYWMLQDDMGTLFGIRPANDSTFWVSVEVVELVTPTPTNAPSPTITVSIYQYGNAQFFAGEYFNLDTGKVTEIAGADLILRKTYTSEYVLSPVNGVRVSEFGSTIPTLKDCMNQELGDDTFIQIKVGNLESSNYYCFITDQELPGYLIIRKYDMIESRITLDYVVWAIP